MTVRLAEPALDKKTRTRLEDERRMAYRRAIEEHAELRRMRQELGDVPEQLAGLYLSLGLGLRTFR